MRFMRHNLIFAAALLVAYAGTALAQETAGPDALVQSFIKSTKGKTVAFVPIATGVSVMDIWTGEMQRSFDFYGINFKIRDPNWADEIARGRSHKEIARRLSLSPNTHRNHTQIVLS